MGDQPKGYLPISDAMARDLDNGRADNRAIEDFMPDSALQEIKDYNASKSVVRGEDLIPISKAEAASRTRFDGESLPNLPSTRRVIPAPYKRDRVTGGKHGKKWHEMLAEGIEKGDIIPDVGLVRGVAKEIRYEGEGKLGPIAAGFDVTVYGGDGQPHVFDSKKAVRVFR